jgi:LysM repeat protein
MSSSKYDSDFDYDEPERYHDPQVTSVGLPPGQMALIIGVNAVISLVIAVAVVLIANRQVTPATVAQNPASAGTPAATVSAPEATVAAAESSAESSPEPVVTNTPLQSVTYEVAAGDTLSSVAGKFSVSVYDLMVANGLSDENFIQIGQVLIIPLGGVPTTTPTFTPEAVPTDTPLPFDPPTPIPTGETLPQEPAATVGPSPTPSPTIPVTPTSATAEATVVPADVTPEAEVDVAIQEVLGAGDLVQETVIILNQGAGTSMNNWKLSGSSLGNFVFPDIFLFSGGSIRVHTVVGQNTPSDLYLGQGEPAWPSGTQISLINNTGDEVSSLRVP